MPLHIPPWIAILSSLSLVPFPVTHCRKPVLAADHSKCSVWFHPRGDPRGGLGGKTETGHDEEGTVQNGSTTILHYGIFAVHYNDIMGHYTLLIGSKFVKYFLNITEHIPFSIDVEVRRGEWGRWQQKGEVVCG